MLRSKNETRESEARAWRVVRPGAALTPGGLAGALVAGAGVIVFLCLLATAARFEFGVQHGPLNVIPLFDLHKESTVPAWYSTMLLFCAAVLLGAIGWVKAGRREAFARHWLALGVIFLLLSMDEAVSIHERLSWPMRHVVDPDGFYFYAWVIPASLGVAVLGLIYLRFLLHLPARTRRWMVVSAAMFLGGALGMEMIEGWYHSRHGDHTAAYAAMVAVEELMEMVGVALFLYALLDYVREQWGGVWLALHTTEETTPSPAQLATAARQAM